MVLMDNYGKKDTSGGRIWQGIAEYGSNPSVKFFVGADTFAQEVSQTALPIQVQWRYLGGSVGMARTEMAENRGQAALFNIAESRLRQATRTMATVLNGEVYSDGTNYGGNTITASRTSSPRPRPRGPLRGSTPPRIPSGATPPSPPPAPSPRTASRVRLRISSLPHSTTLPTG